MFGFYLSSQHTQFSDSSNTSLQNKLSENQLNDKDSSIRQKLANDFETAFLKQYTPLVGCEELDNNTKTAKCSQHLEQAKNDFKQQFIKNRGLPKDTFEDLKLSFTN